VDKLASNLGHPQIFKLLKRPDEGLESPEDLKVDLRLLEAPGKVLGVVLNKLRPSRTLLEVDLSQFEVKIGDLEDRKNSNFLPPSKNAALRFRMRFFELITFKVEF